MTPIFKKLNLAGQTEIIVLNAPVSFEPELAALIKVIILRDTDQAQKINFSLAFVSKQDEVNSLSKTITGLAEGDAIIWFAYPKGTSKKYKCDFNRDNGWDVLVNAGFEPVRQVAIDENWSALRFRRFEYIKKRKKET